MYNFFSKLAYWVFFNQLILLVIIYGISVIFYLIKKNHISKLLFISGSLYLFTIALFPTGTILLYNLEKPYINNLPDKIDGILVLSGGEEIEKSNEYNQIYSGSSTYRILESIRLQNKYPKTIIIYSGGSIDLSENKLSTEVAEKFYREFSSYYANIVFENKSANTYQNIINSKKIANPKKSEKWVVITSAFHMKRTLMIASKVNWQLIPYPVDFKLTKNLYSNLRDLNVMQNINNFQLATHELLGIYVYKILGRAA